MNILEVRYHAEGEREEVLITVDFGIGERIATYTNISNKEERDRNFK